MNTETLKAMLSIWGPRVAGVAGAYAVGEAAKHGLTLDQEQVTGIMLGVYAYLHRAISKKVNPGDATKSVLVKQDKKETQRLTPPSAPNDYERGSEL
jgi:hypothetical protein